MPRLSQSDCGLVLAFLEKVHGCRSEEDFPKVAVAGLAEIVPAEYVIWNYMAPSVPAAWTVSWPEIQEDERRTAVFAEHMREHPVVQHMLRTDDPSPRLISDFWSEREFHHAPIYDALYRDLFMEDQLGFWLSGLAPEMVGIAFNRRQRNFTERERAMLGLVRPHLAQAWRNARSFSRLRRLALTRRRANLELDNSIVMLDTNGRVTRLSARARKRLAEFFADVPPASLRLPPALEQWIAGQTTAGNGRQDVCPPLAPLVRDRDGHQLVARLLRDSGGWLLVLEKRMQPAAAQSLRRLGLTRREIDVLLEVEKGRANKEIAATLSVSPHTTRKHLENIFNKLGVTSRTAAVRIAHENLA